MSSRLITPRGATEHRLAEVKKGHARGWSYTPLNGKRPLLKGWQAKPRETEKTASAWAVEGNVGLRTGSASGVVIIDEDRDKGGSVGLLELPRTATVETGGGGRHYYFRAPEGELKNSAGKLVDHVDVRGDGGAAAFVGSIHPDTGKLYTWAKGLSPDEVELAELPEHILQMCRRKKPRPSPEERAKEVMKDGLRKLRTVGEGKRNEALNALSFRLGKLVARGDLDETHVTDALRSVASEVGLDAVEIESTIDSGLQAGIDDVRRMRRKGLPTIRVEAGRLPEAVDEGEAALIASRVVTLYEYGGLVVRLVRSLVPSVGAANDESPLAAEPVDVPFLVDVMTQSANWEKWDGRLKDYKPIDCPEKIAKVYLSRSGSRRISQLVGITTAPTLRPDGTVLDEPGYDAQTKLLFDPGDCVFEPILDEPSLSAAKRAMGELKVVLEGFPFVGPQDRSVALSSILTAVARNSVRTAPMFLARAPKMGSGKSLLVDVAAYISTGSPAAVMSQPKDEEESRKRIFALLLEGAQVISIDNVEHPLGDATLCSVLTQALFRDRVLGFSRTATVPTAATFFATGNNMVVVGDLTSRVLPCDLDPKCEHPEEREFDVDLHRLVPARRGRLVSAALTILRAFVVAGRPKQNLPVFGRFEGWSDLIRSALVWCGEPDPCLGRRRLEVVDPVSDQLRSLLSGWYKHLGDEPATASEVIQRLEAVVGVRDLLLQAARDDTGELSPLRFGRWLQLHQGRIEGGLVVRRMPAKQGTARWKVESTSGGSAYREGVDDE